MFAMEYTSGAWRDPRIVPYGDISLPPAAAVFHYGAEVFEGLKAYRRKDGGVQLFRPLDNMHRLNDSAARLCLPQIDPDVGLEALKALVKIDAAWVQCAGHVPIPTACAVCHGPGSVLARDPAGQLLHHRFPFWQLL